MIAVLSELGLLAPGARRRLRPRLRPVVRGGGRPVGHLEPVLTLTATSRVASLEWSGSRTRAAGKDRETPT